MNPRLLNARKVASAWLFVFVVFCAAGFGQALCGAWSQPCGPHGIAWISSTADGPHEGVNAPSGPFYAYPGLLSTDPLLWTDVARSIYDTNPYGYHLPAYATAALEQSGLPNNWPGPTFLPTAAQRRKMFDLARYFCNLPEWQFQNGMTGVTWATNINQYQGNTIAYPPPWIEPSTPTTPCSVIPTPGFMTLAPCRLLDTRNPVGSLGGPALVAGADRTFVFTGQCGIPAEATSVSVNVAVTQPTAGPGFLTLYPAGSALPLAATVNYAAGQTRANNATVALGAGGAITVHCGQGSGTAHVIIDVNGYVQY